MNGSFVVRGGTSLPANRDGEPLSLTPTRTTAARHGNCPTCGALHGKVRDCAPLRTANARRLAAMPGRRPVAAPARRPVATPARRPVAAPASSTWRPGRAPIPAGAGQTLGGLVASWADGRRDDLAAIRKAKTRQWFAPAPGTY